MANRGHQIAVIAQPMHKLMHRVCPRSINVHAEASAGQHIRHFRARACCQAVIKLPAAGRSIEQAFRNVFASFDKLEARLSRHRWLVGGRFTAADLRLFPTLIRFDTVYYSLFKCNLRRVADYHNLSNYMREIYRMPDVAATVDVEKIKLGYYGGMRHLNPKGIPPLGAALDFAAPHDRLRISAV